MRFAAALCFVLGAAAASASADPLPVISDAPLNGLPMESRAAPINKEALSLQAVAPSAGRLTQSNIEKCNTVVAQAVGGASKPTVQNRCIERLLGP
jgi:hypothetical protein